MLSFVLLAGLVSFAQNPTSSQSDQLPTYKVNVKLVNVFVTVLNQKGQPVGGLQKQDFKLFEDGVPQTISVFNRESGLPLSIVLAVDTSLSTKRDLPLELESARKFAHSIVRPQDALSLFEFSETVDEMTRFTSNLNTIDNGIKRIHNGAATALYDAIYLGSQSLAKRDGRKVLVVITDGGDTVSQVNYQEALRAAQESEAIVYSLIVVPIEADAGRDLGGEHALIQMSDDTGGKYFYASGIAQLDKAFQQISDDLRTQYQIGYYPIKRVTDSDFRHIKLDVTSDVPDGPLVARHRTGYYTTKDVF
ncbi:MAG TPA: VWA domain-containing protein [Terriglobales bacterium]|nr:VWA domain-containing protein [Terriglobales bacterium]